MPTNLSAFVDTAEIATDAVTSDEILADAVTGSEIASSAVDTGHIATDAVTSDEILADAVTPSEVDRTQVYQWASQHQFDAGLDTRGDIVDDTVTIWNSSAGYLEQSALQNDSIDVVAGNALAGGGTVALGGSTTVDVASNAIQVDEIDESIAPTWTSEHTFSGGITGLPDPTAESDAANKRYVDAVEQALDIKDSVRVATDGASVDLASSTDPNPIDGVTLADGDRVLLKDQSTASENGIYVAQTATDPTTWVRAPDADDDDEVNAGLFTFVEEGTSNQDRGFVLVTNDPISVGTDALDFTQFSGAGQITAGNALFKDGDTLGVESNAIQTDEIDESIVPTWSSQHQFSAGVDTRGDIVDGTTTIWNSSAGYIEQTALENASVTVAGNSVSLGGSTAIDHADLSNIASDQHHTRYSDSEAQSAVDGTNLSLQTLEILTNHANETTDLLMNANANVASDSSIYYLTSGSSGTLFAFEIGRAHV